MIKFIMDGGIGWKNEHGRVELKVAGDIVSGDKAKEQRLVDEGKAVYVADTTTKIEAVEEKPVEKTEKFSKNKPDTKNKKESKADEEPPVLSAAEPE